jgi:hypothetical protein
MKVATDDEMLGGYIYDATVLGQYCRGYAKYALDCIYFSFLEVWMEQGKR